jgi:hypothetical protein
LHGARRKNFQLAIGTPSLGRTVEIIEVGYRKKAPTRRNWPTPEWKELSARCVQWDEASLDPQEDACIEEDPYRVVVVTTDRAENIFRWALRDGELRAHVHNVRTGIDLELDPKDWLKSGEQVGINFDYTGPQMPGPDCALNGMRQPIFLYREEFEQWMARTVGVDAPNLTGAHVRPDPGETKRVLATRAFSVEEVMERTGLSKTNYTRK